ncbi:MAG: hypothetical protein A3D44_01030 [Candidatus Staskawiczbacteria bacterium RIFCSPHIGHO2_02_FULL_42_22]|uniref:Uncharacterized protein n=1 Tax=Candidatus Staskawiczbacteria bacterium RIFCSPHIGHO2_02_FULL_42_22 TaxID=1802207 RepID=A0A1G2I374_9BACT|nr:MAG: hypothetical protein A3D44_01030 [Candidatus Staskawiczbacteria bacterium RIFCSPHIGHO2_02_FULL_42_22]
MSVNTTIDYRLIRKAERLWHTNLVREIFGNPFRPIAIDSAWLGWNDAAVVRLANSIYNTPSLSGIPILADALEESGCTDTGILEHLRGPGPHFRGCWVLDLLLGKA